ncbi:hypothetical protein [Dyadobacter sandarakinus]|uniref:Glycosyltransferase RgtA/B/C/D-like domain-containing protein n=1 Tax=Dyadobacter sandarakinus TaxID=2747268 RepID=A0ABX7I5C6_9BACT|nr:hypothetical protein [Dyadobacter sandarakinus]QRR01301.1 hypothetical protein HWI92_10500 [Dyadobacter sandarakinus]
MILFYFLAGSAGLCLVSFLSLFKSLRGVTNPLYNNDVLFLVGISTCLIITKICFFNAGMMNVDESIMLSAGRTFGSDLRPWMSVDPTTSGPLNFIPAMLLLRLTDAASYGELRIIYVLAFQIPAIWVFFFTFRRVSDAFTARLLIMPLVLTLGLFYYHDLIHASSEHMPMFFMSCVFCVLILIGANQVRPWQLVLAAVLCAASFYTKLQVTPIFFCMGALCFLLLVSRKAHCRNAVLFASCFILANVAALSLICIYGGFDDFFQSYIVGNFSYAGTIPLALTPAVDFLKHSIIGMLPLLAMGVWVSLLFLQHVGRPYPQQRSGFLFFLGLVTILLISGYCVVKPGRFFLHYSLLLVIPLYGLIAWTALRSVREPLCKQLLVPGLAIALLWGFDAVKASKVIREWNNLRVVNKEVIDRLQAARQPADRMAVWGWGSPYLHASGMLMGTRDVHNDFQISFTGASGTYYRQRFLSDLEINHPRWFLDISLEDRPDTPKVHSLQDFMEIQQFVTQYYSEVYRTGTEVLYRHKYISVR